MEEEKLKNTENHQNVQGSQNAQNVSNIVNNQTIEEKSNFNPTNTQSTPNMVNTMNISSMNLPTPPNQERASSTSEPNYREIPNPQMNQPILNSLNAENISNMPTMQAPMPDSSTSNNSNNKWIIVIIIAILALGIGGVTVWRYTSSKAEPTTKVKENKTENEKESNENNSEATKDDNESNPNQNNQQENNSKVDEKEPTPKPALKTLTCKKFGTLEGVRTKEVFITEFDSQDLYVRNQSLEYTLDYSVGFAPFTDKDRQTAEKNIKEALKQQMNAEEYFEITTNSEGNVIKVTMTTDYNHLMLYNPSGFTETGEFYFPVFRKLYASNGYTCTEK